MTNIDVRPRSERNLAPLVNTIMLVGSLYTGAEAVTCDVLAPNLPVIHQIGQAVSRVANMYAPYCTDLGAKAQSIYDITETVMQYI